jgi:hypothetical protein
LPAGCEEGLPALSIKYIGNRRLIASQSFGQGDVMAGSGGHLGRFALDEVNVII